MGVLEFFKHFKRAISDRAGAQGGFLPRASNPRKIISDQIPVWIKVFFKEIFKETHHNTIIPANNSHGAWILGAQPSEGTLRELSEKKSIHIVSMLHDDEMVVKDDDLPQISSNTIQRTRIPWFDHSAMNIHTGKNICVTDLMQEQDRIAIGINTDIYCHCMAGKSRSFVETIVYLYRNHNALFDFNSWPPEMCNRIPKDLYKKLQTRPTMSDIAEFVAIQRPGVHPLVKLDGDQAGLLGLVALHVEAGKLQDDNNKITDGQHIERLAKDIGLVLYAPLDNAFREKSDRQEQEANFNKIFNACGTDENKELLLRQIVIQQAKLSDKSLLTRFKRFFDISHIQSESTDFQECFKRLKPSQQARFIISLKELKIPLPTGQGELLRVLAECKKIVFDNASKLPAGDQVELLRSFGSDTEFKLNYKDVANKIVNGTEIDKHNAGIQLANVLNLPVVPGLIESEIKKYINKLPKEEQTKFKTENTRLKELKVAGEAAKTLQDIQPAQSSNSKMVQELTDEQGQKTISPPPGLGYNQF